MTPSAARRSAKGSPEPVGFSSDREEAGQLVELVGQRHGDRDRLRRHRIARAERPVMRADRLRHARVLAALQRVVAAHHPLQFGEFADHAGGEIGLGQLRRACRQRRVGADQRRDQRRPAVPAAAPARPGCRAWRGTPRPPASAGSFPAAACRSWSQKNRASDSRARSTRSLPATIAAPPSCGTMLDTTAKRAAGPAIRVPQREIALVHPHRGPHDLRRQVHDRRRRSGRAAAPAIPPARRPRPAGRGRAPPPAPRRRPGRRCPSR